MEDAKSTEEIDLDAEAAEPEWDRLAGIATDGVVGAVGGAVGTAVMTVVLVAGAQVGAFDVGSFATLSQTVGASGLLGASPVGLGYALFVLGGMVIWPLLLVSIGTYLPGARFATQGLPFGVVLWTGFAPAFYGGQTGLVLAGYVVVTLVGHLAYGFALGSVFDYLTERPATLV